MQRLHELVDVRDVVVEDGGANADQADQMRVAAADRTVAVLIDELLHALVFAATAAAVQRFDRDHTFDWRFDGVMLTQANGRPARVTGQGDPAHVGHRRDELLRRQPHIGEVEPAGDIAIDAVHEHVPVVGFHLGTAQNEEAIPIENADVKQNIFRELDDTASPEAILASNTSSISITKIAAATQRPEK